MCISPFQYLSSIFTSPNVSPIGKPPCRACWKEQQTGSVWLNMQKHSWLCHTVLKRISRGIIQALMGCDLSTQKHQERSHTSAATPELENIFQKLSDLESEYRCLERPIGLPDSIEQWSDSADDSSFESVSPTAGVRSTMQSMVNEPAVWNEKTSKSWILNSFSLKNLSSLRAVYHS